MLKDRKPRINPAPFSPPNGPALNFQEPAHLTFNVGAVNNLYATFQPSYPWQPRQPPHLSGRQLCVKRRAWTLGFDLGVATCHHWGPWPCFFAALSFAFSIRKPGMRANIERCVQ